MNNQGGWGIHNTYMYTMYTYALICICSIIQHTLFILQSSLNFFHVLAWAMSLPMPHRMLSSTCRPSSVTSLCRLTSLKKVNFTSSSCPGTACGGASIQEPRSQRGNFLVLERGEIQTKGAVGAVILRMCKHTVC